MTIRILQDHTDFMNRMLEHAMDSNQGMPLNIPALEALRAATVGAKYKGKICTAAKLRELMRSADDKERRKLAIILADAVELELEGWYCVANPDDIVELRLGPVLKWNGASWWGKLKGVECPVELEFDVGFVKRKRGAPRPAPQQERGPRSVVGAALLGMVGGGAGRTPAD